MQPGSPLWLDTQYNNRARVPQALQHLQRWAGDSGAARSQLLAGGQAILDQPYMDVPTLAPYSQILDIFIPPSHVPAPEGGWPVLVFIHGGYWRALDKSDHSFLASAWVNGLCGGPAVMVVPNYALCPAVRVSDITTQMQQALAWVWRRIAFHGGNPRRITTVGHSAGGHLVGMLLSTSWSDFGLPASPIRSGVAISGLFDLEPIRQTPFLADLGLTADEAFDQSPVHRPHTGGALHTVVGGDESEEFLRQNALLQSAWGPVAAPVAEVLPGLNHFSVLEELTRPDSALAERVGQCLAQ